jgi:hypothetical protein
VHMNFKHNERTNEKTNARGGMSCAQTREQKCYLKRKKKCKWKQQRWLRSQQP